MTTKNVDLYLYLGRRDKGGIRIIAKLKGTPQMAIRIDDLTPFQFPTAWKAQLEQIIFESRMLWEPWIESADTFDKLRENLKIRGYLNVPISSQPEFTSSSIQTPIVNVSHLPSKTTMLRKKN